MQALFRLGLVLLLAAGIATAAAAQSTFSEDGSPDPDPSISAELLDILKTPEGQAALIDALESAAATQDAEAATAEASAEDAPSAETETLSQELAPEEGSGGILDNLIAVPQAMPTQDGGEGTEEAEPDLSPGVAALRASREFLAFVSEEISDFWARAQRIPNTLELSLRAWDPDLFRTVVVELALALAISFGSHALYRRLSRGWRRSFEGDLNEISYLRLVQRRTLVSLIDLGCLGLAILTTLAILGIAEGDLAEISAQQTLFLITFASTEFLRVVMRFVLSPTAPSLRIIELGPKGVARLWRIGNVFIYTLGYGQLLLVPMVSATTSVFVGRALATVIGALSLVYLIGAVLMYRREVAAWLKERWHPSSVAEGTGSPADYWHVPLLIYLLYFLAVVLTRPGTTLLTMLWNAGLLILTLTLGAMAIAGMRRQSRRPVRIPRWIGPIRLILQERLTQLRPRAQAIFTVVVVAIVIVISLDLLGFIEVSEVTASPLGRAVIERSLGAIVILFIAAFVWLCIQTWADYKVSPFVGTPPTPRQITIITLLRNALTIALLILTAITVLSEIGVNTVPIVASAGVLGLAVSFGAQSLVQDIITGAFIQFENAMNVGDVVDVGGVVGTVERLTVRSVTLRDVHGVVHMIPFSNASKISNFMRDYSYAVMDVGVGYDSDRAQVAEAMQEAFDNLVAQPDQAEKIIGELEWFGLQSFADSAIIYRARIKTTPGTQWGVARSYNAHIKDALDARGIEIPFPQRTVTVTGPASAQVPREVIAAAAGD